MEDKKGRGGDAEENEEQERAVANLFDGQPSIQEVCNGPCGSQGQGS